MVNKVILIGHLGRDPEIRRLDNGAVVAKFSIATNESYKDKNGEWQNLTEWHDIVMWRQLAERAEKYLAKGRLVFIEGKLTHRKYQDKDALDRYITEVVANQLKLLDRKESGDSSYSASDNRKVEEPEADTSKSSRHESVAENTNETDDLPF